MDALPALLARDGNLAKMTAICRLDNGKRMVSIVTARNLFGNSAIKEALHTANLQVLMTAGGGISSWPKNAELRAWLEPALKPGSFGGRMAKMILIVDDSVTMLMSVNRSLSLGCYPVETANEGRMAIDKLIAALKPYMIFTDINMPVMGGSS